MSRNDSRDGIMVNLPRLKCTLTPSCKTLVGKLCQKRRFKFKQHHGSDGTIPRTARLSPSLRAVVSKIPTQAPNPICTSVSIWRAGSGELLKRHYRLPNCPRKQANRWGPTEVAGAPTICDVLRYFNSTITVPLAPTDTYRSQNIPCMCLGGLVYVALRCR